MEKKRIIFTSLIFGLIFQMAFGQTEFDSKLKSLYKNTVPLIRSDVLATSIVENSEIVILDTRSYEEFEVSHLPNALFLDYDKFKTNEVEGINRKTKIIVYCSVGYRSERIGEKLLKMGFVDVRNLYGGIFDWVNNENTVVNQAGIKTDSVHTYNKDWSRWLTRGVKVY
jgi:rhodanese-related sulfurtransferase